jgi:hypothetical protein
MSQAEVLDGQIEAYAHSEYNFRQCRQIVKKEKEEDEER